MDFQQLINKSKEDKQHLVNAIAEIMKISCAETRFADAITEIKKQIKIYNDTIASLQSMIPATQESKPEVVEADNSEDDTEFEDIMKTYPEKIVEDLNPRELQVFAAIVLSSQTCAGGDFTYFADTVDQLNESYPDQFSQAQVKGYFSQLQKKDYIVVCEEYYQVNVCQKSKAIDAEIEEWIPELY